MYCQDYNLSSQQLFRNNFTAGADVAVSKVCVCGIVLLFFYFSHFSVFRLNVEQIQIGWVVWAKVIRARIRSQVRLCFFLSLTTVVVVPFSFSNFVFLLFKINLENIVTKHVELLWNVDFNKQTISGEAILHFEIVAKEVERIVSIVSL